jgi:hypothetical protein
VGNEISIQGQPDDFFHVDPSGRLPVSPYHRLPGLEPFNGSAIVSQSFPTASIAAAALRALGLDDHVAELGRQARKAPIDPSSNHQPRAYSLLDVDENQIRAGTIREIPLPDLSQSAEVSLVVEQHWSIQLLLQLWPKREIGPAKVAGCQNRTCFVIHQPDSM